MDSFPYLTVLCAVPLVGAFAVAALPPGPGGRSSKFLALAVSLVTLVIGAVVLTRFHVHDGMQLTEHHTWIKALGVHYAVGVDGLGLLMVLLTVVLVPIVFLASWNDLDDLDDLDGADASGGRDVGRGRPTGFFAWALALEAFALLVFCATDVFLFYVVFEVTLIPAYFLIGGYGGRRRGDAALKFLMFQLGGGLVLLASVIGLYVVSARAGTPSYDLSSLEALHIGTGAGRWLFVGFFVAFAVKAPLFPLHTWLADTTEQATPGTSVLLVCVLDKIGTFGMLRFCLGIFPEASRWATPVVVAIALVSIVYGALIAIGQDDVLRLIGLTSLSHFGFITLGIFVLSGNGGSSSEGGSGAILYMVNHGIGTAALFLVAGYLIRRRGTSKISEMVGLERATPLLAGLFLVAGLATLGLPGLSTFVSEFLVMLSAFDYHWWVGAIAVTGIVLAAIYVLWMYQRTMTGPTPEAVEGTPDAHPRELVAVAPLVVALVVFGFFPRPLLDAANPYITGLMSRVGVQDQRPSVPLPHGYAIASDEGSH